MGAAAYNRGSACLSKQADEAMPIAVKRADRAAHKDETARLKDRVAELERDLSRARRALAAERYGREQLRVRLAREESAYAFAVGILCRRAFAEDDT